MNEIPFRVEQIKKEKIAREKCHLSIPSIQKTLVALHFTESRHAALDACTHVRSLLKFSRLQGFSALGCLCALQTVMSHIKWHF